MNVKAQSDKQLQVIILAAGKGTRMYSSLPKVLHKIAGKSLVEHVIDSAEALNAESISLIYGHGGELVKESLIERPLIWCEQKEQLGTGHAVQQAIDAFAARGIDAKAVRLESSAEVRAKSPTAYGVFGIVCDGRLLTYHYLGKKELRRLDEEFLLQS